MSQDPPTASQNTPQNAGSSKETASRSLYLQPKTGDDAAIDVPEGYEFIKTIGDGSFGKVKLAVHKLTQ